MGVPARLYKYLPSRFADDFVRRGDLFFCNLAHFRKIEDRGRRDLLEGLHMDRPDGSITIEMKSSGYRWQGKASFLNAIDPQRLLVLCLSELLLDSLFEKFRSDTCVEITDPSEFIRRCRMAVEKQFQFRDSDLLHGGVLYYAPNRPAPIDVTNPKQIPFCKHETYSQEREYRLAVPLKGALTVTRRIVNELFSFDEEVAAGISDERHVIIGCIDDIATLHSR